MNLQAAKAELAADSVEALAIAVRQLPFGTLLQPADGDDDQAHGMRRMESLCSRAPDGAQYKVHALSPIRIGQRLARSPLPPPDSASTTFPGCRIREPPA